MAHLEKVIRTGLRQRSLMNMLLATKVKKLVAHFNLPEKEAFNKAGIPADIFHKTEEYAAILRDIVDWGHFFRVVKTMGRQCNGPKERFDKADIVEQSVDACSGGVLKWVDKIGRDNHDTVRNLDLEVKSEINSLFTSGGRPKRRTKLIIKNFHGDSFNGLPDPADYYLIINSDPERHGAAIISGEHIMPFLKNGGAVINAIIPREASTFIHTPETLTTPPLENNTFNYIQQKRDAQMALIRSCK